MEQSKNIPCVQAMFLNLGALDKLMDILRMQTTGLTLIPLSRPLNADDRPLRVLYDNY